jgi:XTP/dITP diphosphohydrolase
MIEHATLILGTGNRGKAAELVALLDDTGLELLTLADVPSPLSVDEGSESFAENARRKASQQAAHLGRWVLGDDTGLQVDALGGVPGVHTARYAGPNATGADNRRRLLTELADVPLEWRTARFVCYLALADPRGTIRAESEGHCRGRILLEPRGELGFGYDSLFEVVEYHRTFAELGELAKAVLSHRARAMERIRPRLMELLQSAK